MFPLLLLIQSIPNLECYAEIKTLDFPDIKLLSLHLAPSPPHRDRTPRYILRCS